MFKTLVRKQFLELFARFVNGTMSSKKKSKKNFSKKQRTGIFLLCIILLAVIAGVCWLANTQASILVPNGMGILYFSVFASGVLALSIVLNTLIARTTLFDSRDNELILSLPIPPNMIFLSRMATLILNCVVISFILWIPPVIVYMCVGGFSLLSLVFSLLNVINISLAVLVIACLIGWIASLISRFAKFKKFATIVFFVVIAGLAVFASTAFKAFTSQIVQDPANLLNTFQTNLYPLYLIGSSSMGNVTDMLILTAACVVSFVVLYVIISKTYFKLLTTKRSAKKKVYTAKKTKQIKASSALFNKDFSMFKHYTVYIINTALGVFLAVLLLIPVFIFRENITEFASMLMSRVDGGKYLVSLFIFEVFAFLAALDVISTPAVSMEGNTMWILKTLPVKPYDILKSKLDLHISINAGIIGIASAIAAFVITGDFICVCIVVALIILFVNCTGQFGLIIGTKRANLTWINPAVPVKQSLAILFSIIFSVGLLAIIVAATVFSLKSQIFDGTAIMSFNVLAMVFLAGLAILSIIFWQVIKTVSVKDLGKL